LAKYVQIHPLNPELRKIEEIVKILRNDGIIIYPTDTVYAIGCDIYNNKAMEKLSRIKGVKPEKANFSFICYDLSHISDFTMPFSTSIYKMMRRNLPGAFTFILNANNSIPKLFKK
jgi:tRNA threonylcarbamoyl adenosine modification protein (Sua5/YciO/YrdC/YwlC family)